MNEEPTHKQSTLETSTRLAYERTYLAHERTLMGWCEPLYRSSRLDSPSRRFLSTCARNTASGDASWPSGHRHHHDRDRTRSSGVGDYAISAGFKGIA